MERFNSLLIAGAVLLVAFVVYIAFRAERGRRDALREQLRDLGFIPVEPGAELLRRLTSLQVTPADDKKPSKSKFKVDHVFSRRGGDTEMFVFNITETGKDDGHAEQQSLAVVSDRLRMPSFVLLPRAGGDGMLAKMTDKAISWAAHKMGDPVEFPQHPEFEQRYLVRSSDPDGTRRFLDANRLNRLAETRHLFIRARDDVFAVSAPARAWHSAREPLRERVDQASKIFSILSS